MSTRHPPPRKQLGQHFLTDPRLLARIADALALAPGETVIEIGPGRGALTEALRQRARRVIAIEKDRRLAALLRERYEGDASVRIVEADVLATPLGALAGGAYALAGNIPYYITTPILFHALEPPRPARAVFLVQREVAERLSAEPGTREYGALTVNVQALAAVETLFRIAPGAFQPPPRVESAVVRITPRAEALIAREMEPRFQAVVQGAFGLRRKQMRRVVRTLMMVGVADADRLLGSCGVDPEARPETLAPDRWACLVRAGLDVRSAS